MATVSEQPDDRYPDSEGPFAGPNNTFPLNTAGRVRSAWSRIHQSKVIANHSAAEIADIKRKIRARAKQLGIVLEEHDDTPAGTDSVSSLERAFTPGKIELRGGSGRTIFGHAAVFDQLSRRMEFGYEVVTRSAFDVSAAAGWPDTVCRAEHDSRMLLGATASGTLRLAVDQRGLAYECDLAPSRQDVLESCARGDYAGSSWAFHCLSDEFEFRDGSPVRNLLSCKVIDTAPVTVPAYSTGARACGAWRNTWMRRSEKLSSWQPQASCGACLSAATAPRPRPRRGSRGRSNTDTWKRSSGYGPVGWRGTQEDKPEGRTKSEGTPQN